MNSLKKLEINNQKVLFPHIFLHLIPSCFLPREPRCNTQRSRGSLVRIGIQGGLVFVLAKAWGVAPYMTLVLTHAAQAERQTGQYLYWWLS